MEKIKLIEHTKGYLEKLADGTDPITGSKAADGDPVRGERISKCLRYSASVLERCLGSNIIKEDIIVAYKIAEYKNEEAVIGVAADFLQRISEGVDPVSGQPLSAETILRNERIVKCLSYTADLLKTVKVQKRRFYISEEELDAFAYSDEPIMISQIKDRVDALIDKDCMYGISAGWLTSYLVDLKLLENVTPKGSETSYRAPTKMGAILGITAVRDEQRGKSITTLLYGRKMQELIVKNIPTIIEKYRTADGGENND